MSTFANIKRELHSSLISNKLETKVIQLLDRLTAPLTQYDVRAAGGIIHRDGNIFFTNLDKLNEAVNSRK